MTAKRSTNKDKDNLCLLAQHWTKDDIKKWVIDQSNSQRNVATRIIDETR